MIDIQDKTKCCGCSACVQVCPKHCISFEEDQQGFRYPQVDNNVCVDCHLCEQVCSVLNPGVAKKPLSVWAAINANEEIRLDSSSGGVFTLLAENIINSGGIVFGARFNKNWEIVHDYTETISGIAPFRGSKYVQSYIGESYCKVKTFLDQGRRVLFSGTSCQIDGLRHYLRKDYKNLLLVDVVCHGVPSPLVWRSYLNDRLLHPESVVLKNTAHQSLDEKPVITGISFKDKRSGWKKFGFAVYKKSTTKADENMALPPRGHNEDSTLLEYTTLDNNLFMQIFLKNLCLRPSCSSCPSKSGKCGSDITLADYWGIHRKHPEMYDDMGTSLVLVNSHKGESTLSNLNMRKVETSYDDAFQSNPAIEHSYNPNKHIVEFWNSFNSFGLSNIEQVLNKCQPTRRDYILRQCNRIINRILKTIRTK